MESGKVENPKKKEEEEEKEEISRSYRIDFSYSVIIDRKKCWVCFYLYI
jgi:hypothetical protein